VQREPNALDHQQGEEVTPQEVELGKYRKELLLPLGEAFLPGLAPLPCLPRSSLAVRWVVKGLMLLDSDFVPPEAQFEVTRRPSVDQIEMTLEVDFPLSIAETLPDQLLLDPEPDPAVVAAVAETEPVQLQQTEGSAQSLLVHFVAQ
jgi:hypothetical protein